MLDLLDQLLRRLFAVILHDQIRALRFIKWNIHPYHVTSSRIQSLLIACQQSLFFYPNVNFLILADILAVPPPYRREHGDRTADDINALVGKHLAYTEDPPCPAQAIVLRVAAVLTEYGPDCIPIQIHHIGLCGLESLIKQSTQCGLAGTRQTGTKINCPFVFHNAPPYQ